MISTAISRIRPCKGRVKSHFAMNGYSRKKGLNLRHNLAHRKRSFHFFSSKTRKRSLFRSFWHEYCRLKEKKYIGFFLFLGSQKAVDIRQNPSNSWFSLALEIDVHPKTSTFLVRNPSSIHNEALAVESRAKQSEEHAMVNRGAETDGTSWGSDSAVTGGDCDGATCRRTARQW